MNTIRELIKLSTGKELDIEYPIRLYDRDGNVVYHEDTNGFWSKREYKDGLEVYFENSNGYWLKREYEDGREVYYENSRGYTEDNR